MGRGRGKGKKPAVVSHDDPGSGGEEVIPTYKRRGRPLKTLKDDIAEEETGKIEEEEEEEEEEGDEAKPTIPSKEVKGSPGESVKKRKRQQQLKENSDSNLEENGSSVKSSIEEPTRPIGSRPSGNRRKSKPRRAAEAGVECKGC